jgi:hypothetical protein
MTAIAFEYGHVPFSGIGHTQGGSRDGGSVTLCVVGFFCRFRRGENCNALLDISGRFAKRPALNQWVPGSSPGTPVPRNPQLIARQQKSRFCGHFSRVVVYDFRSLPRDIVLARQSPRAKIPFQTERRQACAAIERMTERSDDRARERTARVDVMVCSVLYLRWL